MSNIQKHGRFGPQQKKKFLRLLAKHGNLKQCAAMVGVSSQAVYKAMNKDEKLKEAVDIARDKAAVVIESEIKRRAIDGVEKDVYFQGEVVGTEIVYSDKMLELLARANIPEYGNVASNLGSHSQPQVNINILNGETKTKLADLLGVTIDQEPVDI